MASLPSISTVPTLSTEERASILDTLFEPCTQLHTLSVSTLREQTFPSYADLISAIGSQLKSLYNSDLASDVEWLVTILSAHPRLGDPKPESLSVASRAEQAQLQSSEDPAQAEDLRNLNSQYESRFPGLRYVVFVNGRDRPTIMADMQSRIERADPKQEMLDAIQAMVDIANDRASKLAVQSKKTDPHKDENLEWEKKLKGLEEEGMPRHEPLAL